MTNSRNSLGKPSFAPEVMDAISLFLEGVALEERGALYAIVRLPQEASPEVANLGEAVAYKYGKDMAISVLHKMEGLAETLGVTFAELQEAFVAAIERRALDGESVLAFAPLCVDKELAYFIDCLGLDLDMKCAVVNAINNLESKRAPGDAEGAREAAQFLEAISVELKKRIKPGYWISMVRDYWERALEEFETLFDQLDSEGVKYEDVTRARCVASFLNEDWVRAGRDFVRNEIAKYTQNEIERMAPPSAEKLKEFMDYLSSKIKPHNWEALLGALKIIGMDDEGLIFSTNDVVELQEWKFEIERMALFINPKNREQIEINPFLNPELAVAMHNYRRRPEARDASQETQDVQYVRNAINLMTRIAGVGTSDDDFKMCVTLLMRQCDALDDPDFDEEAVELLCAYRELRDEERDYIIEVLCRVVPKYKEMAGLVGLLERRVVDLK